jgi:hypothetical protein
MKVKKGILYKIAKWEQLGSDIDTSCGLIGELCAKAFILLFISFLIVASIFILSHILFFIVGLYETGGSISELISYSNSRYEHYTIGLIFSIVIPLISSVIFLPESKLIKRLITSIKDKTCFKIEWVDKK